MNRITRFEIRRMKNLLITLVIVLTASVEAFAQMPDTCKLYFGTNISGLSDWGSEQPFVDMMRSSREWYSKDIDNPDDPWIFNTEQAQNLNYLPNGYPTGIPQEVDGRPYLQKLATIWGSTSGWEAGSYVVLFEGRGELSFAGVTSLERTDENRYTFDFLNPLENILEMVIEESDFENPIQNIRIVKKEYEQSYESEPFNPHWLEKVLNFPSVRFMDWGQTNNWAQKETWNWEDPRLYDWDERAVYDYYTWTTNKGIPYEVMVKLMNDYELDGWVCVPHNSSDDYQLKMAQYFYDNLTPERRLTVEYSNEIWNWMFGQTQWLNYYGCEQQGISWPEGTVPYIQNCMDNWTSVFGEDNPRLTRAVGVQTGWLDVAQRTAFNMRVGSFDVVAGTYYFGLNDESDAILDAMGESATAQDVIDLVREYWQEGMDMISDIKTDVADELGLPIAFYEGGQHITPIPFGEEPTYAQALLDVQRDPGMYDLYMDWYDFLRTLQEGEEPLLCMNFSLISERSARYGSWGLWETMFQDTDVIPAPKAAATMENIYSGCWEEESTATFQVEIEDRIKLFPNPTTDYLMIESSQSGKVELYNSLGRLVYEAAIEVGLSRHDLSAFANGLYFLRHDAASDALKVLIMR